MVTSRCKTMTSGAGCARSSWWEGAGATSLLTCARAPRPTCATDRPTVAGFAIIEASAGIYGIGRIGVSAMKTLETVSRQRFDQVAQNGAQSTRSQGHRAGEAEMMLGHADRKGGRHQRFGGFTDPASPGNRRSRRARVSSQQERG
jgi:hypothetical protein